MADMVPWEATKNETILNKVRFEIARSIARGRGDQEPAPDDADAIRTYLAEHAPPVCDPFCGGGSIPLEAQRLGLRAHGSDLNPVAVLISKATCEIPPKFANRPPANPDRSALGMWKGAQGLAEDIRYYGQWMRTKAEAQIGHLYPKLKVTKAMTAKRKDLNPYVGQELTVIAWLWARTVASPDPIMQGTHVPLVNSFVLSSRQGKEAIVVPAVYRESRRYEFDIKASGIQTDEFTRASHGTKSGRSGSFRCLISGTPITGEYIRSEAMAGHMGTRLMAVVVGGNRKRVYCQPLKEMEEAAQAVIPDWKPDVEFFQQALGFRIGKYGMSKWSDLFTARQLVALATFSNLIAETREKVLEDAVSAGMSADGRRLADGGSGADALADAVTTYLAVAISRLSDTGNALCSWKSSMTQVMHLFSRQAIPMVWDFAEPNLFGNAAGDFGTSLESMAKAVEGSPAGGASTVVQLDAAGNTPLAVGAVIATDPPYYDNIGYADLSDFFYVWQRRALLPIWPNLYRRTSVPKEEELVATPARHGGTKAAEGFFLDGMVQALRNMHTSGTADFPVTIYYAFKQAEISKEGLTSSGWAAFLQAIVDCGYVIDGTWPIRTELSNRTRGIGSNALASSIVLVCRKREADARPITRREFVAGLRATLPSALTKIRLGGAGPVDIAQAALGPGMGVFTAASRVLEPDDTPMTVRTAISLINQVRDEISGEEATSYDAETRFCIDWFDAFAFDEGDAGDAITMAQAYDTGIDDLELAGVFTAHGGRANLLNRSELQEDWDPAEDARLTDWECAQHLARVLESPEGGIEAAARLYAKIDPDRSDSARMLAYRIYDICERKDRAQEAQTWNMLAQEWPALEAAAAALGDDGPPTTLELGLTGGG